ncbi:hypothetical protein N431DRAFT_468076 [Stipitochalara longipes BDJ]|nr:hypothetical protein N431DRAFT_468076 [Stipitochalara longipes BDJ]
MQLTSVITFAVLVLGVTSHPSLNVFVRNDKPSCSGGQVYNCAHNTCVCPPDQYYDTDKSKCCYQPMPPPDFPAGQEPWCSQDKDHSCKYDKNNDYCQNTGWGSTWCQAPPDYPPKTCSDKQKYCADKQQCECPAPMWWDDKDQKCKYQPMPQPSCPPLQSPYCGKSKEQWCAYDSNNDACSDDGTCYTFCPCLYRLRRWFSLYFLSDQSCLLGWKQNCKNYD